MNLFVKFRRRAGYSLAEVVIAMALIVMLSVAGFSACYVGLGIQNRANKNLDIWNAAEAFRSSFLSVCNSNGKPVGEEEVIRFLDDYNARIAFVLDVYDPSDPAGYQGGYSLNGEAWEIVTELESETVVVPPSDPSGEATTQKVIYSGLNFSYDGAWRDQPSFIFSYRYYTREIEINVKLTLRETLCAIEVEGGVLDNNSSLYKREEVFG